MIDLYVHITKYHGKVACHLLHILLVLWSFKRYYSVTSGYSCQFLLLIETTGTNLGHYDLMDHDAKEYSPIRFARRDFSESLLKLMLL